MSMAARRVRKAVMAGRTERRGQAAIELAVGLFSLVLVVSALTYFVFYIVRSLEIENHLRGNQHGIADKIELDEFAAKSVFGRRNLHISEPFAGTDRTIP